MKSWIWVMSALIVVTILSSIRVGFRSENSDARPVSVSVPDVGGYALEGKAVSVLEPVGAPTPKDASVDNAPQVAEEATANDAVVNIGEYMDPDDPSTWPVDENTEVINIGEYMDPDDPSTWPVDENTEVINIGEYMDPDDPSAWPVDENTEVVNIGEYLNPDDPQFWPYEGDEEVINIGEYLDPEDPASWPQP